MKQKILPALIAILLLCDFSFSYLQYYYSPLDGDMAGGIVPAKDVQEIFDDPFGIKVLRGKERHPNPNRFFAHLFFREYFQKIPLLLQKITSPIDSVYHSCAAIKLLIQILIIYFLASIVSQTKSIFSKNLLLVALLLTPLFQTEGYARQMGIIDKSITYTFFYSLPIMLLLGYFWLLYHYFRHNKFRQSNNYYTIFLLILLTIVLPFSGPLIPATVLVLGLLLLIFYTTPLIGGTMRSSKTTLLSLLKNTFQTIPRPLLYFFTPIFILSAYSLFIGTYNSTYTNESIPITERYQRLPIGLYYLFVRKLGLPLLIAFIAANIFIIKKYLFNASAKMLIITSKWIGFFALIYALLLPIGGYRPYRENILRYDTIMPITILLCYLWASTSYFILSNIQKRKKIYLTVLIVFLLIFANSDRLNYTENNCEKNALILLSKSEETIVPLKNQCHVLSWAPIKDAKKSTLNAELLHIWRITPHKVLYYHTSSR